MARGSVLCVTLVFRRTWCVGLRSYVVSQVHPDADLFLTGLNCYAKVPCINECACYSPDPKVRTIHDHFPLRSTLVLRRGNDLGGWFLTFG